MANRASTACGLSARAEKRNAFTGGSGLTWANAGMPIRSASTTSAARAFPLKSRTGSFLGDPFEILGQTMADGDSDNFGKFVRVMGANCRLEPRIQCGAGLDRHGGLLGSFDLAAPVIK